MPVEAAVEHRTLRADDEDPEYLWRMEAYAGG